eukprot:TRINITY_DN4343_c0_g1_i3.p1 TRINITY_DN4343_c0_g1~~TRINITY_DN4343_c0_g1_i3.p1  ORF type:complete len:273 (+),score=45.08 TRINITY_DN4343_c0_g1_i3:53-871(+)
MEPTLFVPRLSRRGPKTPLPSTTKSHVEDLLLSGDDDPLLFDSADIETAPATCCDVHPSKMLAISGCHDGRIITWVLVPQLESRGYKLASIAKFSIHEREITDIRFHPDCERFICASLDGTIKLCSFHDRGKSVKVRHTFRCNSPVFSCSFSKDGLFAVASSFRYVSVFDIQAGLLYKEFTAHELNVHQASWHPNDSKSLITCGDDKAIKVWDLATKTHTSEYHLESWVWTAKFLNRVPPRYIVGGTQHGFVKVAFECSLFGNVVFRLLLRL